MQKKYCSKCGQATEYKSEIPSFCSKCGNSFAGSKGNAVPSKASELHQPRGDDHDEYEHDNSFSSNITSLAFDVQRFDAPTPTIGQVASLGPQENSNAGKSEPLPPVNEEKFLKDFQQEAGSIKQQNG